MIPNPETPTTNTISDYQVIKTIGDGLASKYPIFFSHFSLPLKKKKSQACKK